MMLVPFAITLAFIPAQAPDPVQPAMVLAQARAAYRAGPIAEELTVQITTAHKRTRTASLVVRLDALQPEAPPHFRIEFDASIVEPSLVVFYGNGALVGASTENENDRWIVPDAGPDLASILAHLPPIPIPQLHLVFDLDTRFDRPTPYTPECSWMSADLLPPDPMAGPATIVLHGRSASGPIDVSFDASSFRLRSLHADLEGGAVLDLSVRPVDPGDPAAWAITTAGRRTVPNLSDLTPQRGAIPPGDYVHDIGSSQADGSGWSLHQALVSLPAAPPDGPIPAVALILFRTPDDPLTLAGTEASARLALRALHLAGAAHSLDIHLIAAIDLAAYGDQWPALRQRWGTEAAQGLAPGWATPSTTINRFAPDAKAAIVLVAADRRLIAVIPLGDQTDAGLLADEVRRALSVTP